MTTHSSTVTNKLIRFTSIVFFIFILWIIYLADTGSQSILFKIGGSIPNRDKVGHFVLFGLLTLAFNFILNFKTLNVGKSRVYWGTLWVFVFVVLEELSQGFIATRTMDYVDLLADAAGILLFTGVSFFSKPSNKTD